jgi:hypothetical protein
MEKLREQQSRRATADNADLNLHCVDLACVVVFGPI